MVSKKQYLVRELGGILVYPFFFALTILVLFKIGRIDGDASETSQIFSWFIAANTVASVATLLLTHHLTFRRQKG